MSRDLSQASNNPRGLDLKAIRRKSVERHVDRMSVPGETWASIFMRECYDRRNWHVVVPLGLGHMWVKKVEPFSLMECLAWHALGFQVPVDLWGKDVWKDEMTGHFRFGEETLGADF